MQVDGTLGVTAAISEMLVQSHEGVIDLLPALPTEWSEGKITGVIARGAFELGFQWRNHKLTNSSVLSRKGGVCRLDVKVPVVVKNNGKTMPVKTIGNGIIEFQTRQGEIYSINAK